MHLDFADGAGGIQLEHRGHRMPNDRYRAQPTTAMTAHATNPTWTPTFGINRAESVTAAPANIVEMTRDRTSAIFLSADASASLGTERLILLLH